MNTGIGKKKGSGDSVVLKMKKKFWEFRSLVYALVISHATLGHITTCMSTQSDQKLFFSY